MTGAAPPAPGRPARAPSAEPDGAAVDPARVPIHVVELELAPPAGPPGAAPVLRLAAGACGPVPPGPVLALVRRGGTPLGALPAEVPPGADALAVLTAAARRRFDAVPPPSPQPPPQPRLRADGPAAPLVSVVIGTRERPDRLARCLESAARLRYPRYEVLVVDNAPATGATADLVRRRFAGQVRYLREHRRGLAAAHNRGLAEARGALVAFTDDDVVVDPDWLTALASAFAAEPGAGCVTGLIMPARLETRAQAMLEAHGGFAKGFRRRTYRLAEPPADQPLFPFTAGRLGSGANMAFRAGALRALGGFDPATGTGTPARGGDDLLAFLRVLAAGHALVYQPEALVWHHHRDRPEDLDAQAFGYGAGLGAYLTAALLHEPRLLPGLLRRLPGGVRHALARTAARGEPPARDGTGPGGPPSGRQAPDWPARLSRRERLGMLYGPVGYLRGRLRGPGTAYCGEVARHGG